MKHWSIISLVRTQINRAMALSCLGALFGLATLLLLAAALQQLIELPQRWPWPYAVAALLCTCASYLLRIVAFDQSHLAAFRLEYRLRSDLANHLASLPLGDVQRLGVGTLSKVIQDDVKALHVFVADSTPLYARAYLAPLATLALLLWLDWHLALAVLGVLLGGFAVMAFAMRNNQRQIEGYNQARERVSAAVIEFVQAMPVVRTFDSGHSTFGRYQQALDNYLDVLVRWYRETRFSARFSLALLNPLPTLLVLLVLGAILLPGQHLDLANWLACLLIGCAMAEAMLPLMALKHLINKARLSVERIQQIIDLPTLVVPSSSQAPADASVIFEQVSFTYASESGAALQALSFHLVPGSRTAVVGPSGSGKSTLARLIPRFWDVSAGSIRIGGVDVRAMDSDTLMQQVAFVFQDSFLFAGSIAANIRLGTAASDAEVEAAARAAQAHDFIMQLPQGYATPAGERGQLLSGGQRQRISIARAILQNRPILVLDEATAFADPQNEAALIEALSRLMRGKTVIMIAHRLATIRDADCILVLEEGRLRESGKHQQLLELQGLYARLWQQHEQAQRWHMGKQHD